MKEILNPNSSKQGECPSHSQHHLYPVIEAAGYKYSHSVYVDDILYHCYKFRPGEKNEHNVSIFEKKNHCYETWQTSVSCGSGYKHKGVGSYALRKHLGYKRRRYNLR
jgi:hypothetical protein